MSEVANSFASFLPNVALTIGFAAMGESQRSSTSHLSIGNSCIRRSSLKQLILRLQSLSSSFKGKANARSCGLSAAKSGLLSLGPSAYSSVTTTLRILSILPLAMSFFLECLNPLKSKVSLRFPKVRIVQSFSLE
jgi:hypothetical protein